MYAAKKKTKEKKTNKVLFSSVTFIMIKRKSCPFWPWPFGFFSLKWGLQTKHNNDNNNNNNNKKKEVRSKKCWAWL